MNIDPRFTPLEWFSLDLGPGELAAMALADRLIETGMWISHEVQARIPALAGEAPGKD